MDKSKFDKAYGRFDLIPYWENKENECYYCGTTKSVKYFANVFDPTVSLVLQNVTLCNKCAAWLSRRIAKRRNKAEV